MKASLMEADLTSPNFLTRLAIFRELDISPGSRLFASQMISYPATSALHGTARRQ